LVLGREMRFQVEDDWKTLVNSRSVKDDSYEEHVKALEERLREANKIAGQHSRTSHGTAKRYYVRQTKLEQYKKGMFVYL
jgi:hypothetical protein